MVFDVEQNLKMKILITNNELVKLIVTVGINLHKVYWYTAVLVVRA